jgi:ketosteroid isomerase-like protein
MLMNTYHKLAAAALSLGLAACSQAEAQQSGDAGTQQLADRIAIEDMIVRYYAHLGQGDPSAFGDYYTEDAVFDVNGVVLTGREEIEGIYGGPDEAEAGAQPAREAEAEAESGVSHMLLSNPVIDIEGDTATASFIWTQIRNPDIKGPPEFVEQGREYDRLVKRDGRWLIEKRAVIADSGMPDMFDATYQPRLDYDVNAE